MCMIKLNIAFILTFYNLYFLHFTILYIPILTYLLDYHEKNHIILTSEFLL